MKPHAPGELVNLTCALSMSLEPDYDYALTTTTIEKGEILIYLGRTTHTILGGSRVYERNFFFVRGRVFSVATFGAVYSALKRLVETI